jgi:hypothetical protein
MVLIGPALVAHAGEKQDLGFAWLVDTLWLPVEPFLYSYYFCHSLVSKLGFETDELEIDLILPMAGRRFPST